uniref:Uncharacterized protein n=1 Tax=Tanacetum cinerariifolium TaxID=118510 RepID=A0A6L2K4N5_TANCI|nr:hypothetical protein [Tanacetum cinerariifolium]
MIFDGMLRNLDNVFGKFFMYPRFIQTCLDKQLDGLPTHKEKYDVSFHTKKVFANMKRIGKGFSGKERPLFPTMVGPNQIQIGEGSSQPTDTQHTPTFDMPSPKLQKTQKPRQSKRKTTKIPQPNESINITIDKAVYKEGVTVWVISSFNDEALDKEDTSKQGMIDKIDADEDIALVSTHDDVSTEYVVQDEGIEDVGEEEIVEVVTTAKMLIDLVVDAAQVTTTIADIPVNAAERIVTTAPTITAESTKTNVMVTRAPKRKRVMIQEPEETTTTKIVSSQQPQVQDKEEQLQFTDAEKAKSFMEFMEKRRKLFVAKRDKEKANKPPTKAQQRNIMSTYPEKHGWMENQKTELVEERTKNDEAETAQESSSKRERDELEQERSKKQKIEDDKESAELK